LRKYFSDFEIEALIRREKIPMSENELVYNERYVIIDFFMKA